MRTRLFSFRPALTLRGRKFKGLRGWAGKPSHPPLTDVPVGAAVLAAAFDTVSLAAGGDTTWSGDLYRAASYCVIGGAVASVAAAVTGLWDWWKSTPKGTQARRTANAHGATMGLATVVALGAIAYRAGVWHEPATPVLALILSLAVLLLMVVGGALGGSLVFDYGFNVETSGDHPVWHPSETDVMPGQKNTPSP